MDVTGTISPAWNHMRRVLFRPINAGAWFSFGLIFFLQSCVEGGGGGGSNFSNVGDLFKRKSQYGHDTHSTLTHAFDTNGFAIGVAVAIGLLVGVPLMLLAMWLGARGRMMAIRAVATGRPAVSEHWHATRDAASSFFKFQLVLGLVGVVAFLPLLGGVVYAIVVDADFLNEPMTAFAIIVGLAAIAMVLLFPVAVVSSLARNFVAPIMLKKEISFRPAWREFMNLARGNWGKIMVFWCLRLGFSIAAAVVSMFVTVFTCCLGALPIVNQTLMAPYYAFERAHSLFILQSIGAEYNLIDMPDEGPGGGGYGGYGSYGGYGGGVPGAYGPYGGGPVPPAGGFGAQNPPYS